MDVSFGITASYGPQRVLMALSFILRDNFNFLGGGQSSSIVVHRRNTSSGNSGHFISLLWPQRGREPENTGSLLLICSPASSIEHSEKCSGSPNSLGLQKSETMAKAHRQFKEQALKESLSVS